MTSSVHHFEALYAGDANPWGVGERWYERRKQALALSMLPRERYRHAFEPACGVGYMTSDLAQRCDRLLAADFSHAAVRSTRARTSDCSHVEVAPLALPSQWPADTVFDLLVLSEWLYYLGDEELHSLCLAVGTSVRASGGDVLSCHFKRPFGDRRQTTAGIHALLDLHLGATWARYEDADVSIRIWSGLAPLSGADA